MYGTSGIKLISKETEDEVEEDEEPHAINRKVKNNDISSVCVLPTISPESIKN